MITKDYRVLEGVEYENSDNEFIIDAGEVCFKVYIFCEFDLAFNYIEGEKQSGVDPWCDILWNKTWWPKGRKYDNPWEGNSIDKPFCIGENIDVKGMSLSLIDTDNPKTSMYMFDYDAEKEGCLSNALRGTVNYWMNFTFSGSTLYEKICDEIEQAQEERMIFDRETNQRSYKKVDIRWSEIALDSL